MSAPERSDHLTMYGLVGVAMYLVVGILIGASATVVPGAWIATLGVLWLLGAAAAYAMWNRTVWIPLLASIVLAALWMTAVFTNR